MSLPWLKNLSRSVQCSTGADSSVEVDKDLGEYLLAQKKIYCFGPLIVRIQLLQNVTDKPLLY